MQWQRWCGTAAAAPVGAADRKLPEYGPLIYPDIWQAEQAVAALYKGQNRGELLGADERHQLCPRAGHQGPGAAGSCVDQPDGAAPWAGILSGGEKRKTCSLGSCVPFWVRGVPGFRSSFLHRVQPPQGGPVPAGQTRLRRHQAGVQLEEHLRLIFISAEALVLACYETAATAYRRAARTNGRYSGGFMMLRLRLQPCRTNLCHCINMAGFRFLSR